jgi:hypothetical protein
MTRRALLFRESRRTGGRRGGIIDTSASAGFRRIFEERHGTIL